MRGTVALVVASILAGASCVEDGSEQEDSPTEVPSSSLTRWDMAIPTPGNIPTAHPARAIFSSTWAGWSPWSFCVNRVRIRVRACNTVRGFSCMGPNQETEPCPHSLYTDNRPSRVREEAEDPWEEDRREALRQLLPPLPPFPPPTTRPNPNFLRIGPKQSTTPRVEELIEDKDEKENEEFKAKGVPTKTALPIHTEEEEKMEVHSNTENRRQHSVNYAIRQGNVYSHDGSYGIGYTMKKAALHGAATERATPITQTLNVLKAKDLLGEEVATETPTKEKKKGIAPSALARISQLLDEEIEELERKVPRKEGYKREKEGGEKGKRTRQVQDIDIYDQIIDTTDEEKREEATTPPPLPSSNTRKNSHVVDSDDGTTMATTPSHMVDSDLMTPAPKMVDSDSTDYSDLLVSLPPELAKLDELEELLGLPHTNLMEMSLPPPLPPLPSTPPPLLTSTRPQYRSEGFHFKNRKRIITKAKNKLKRPAGKWRSRPKSTMLDSDHDLTAWRRPVERVVPRPFHREQPQKGLEGRYRATPSPVHPTRGIRHRKKNLSYGITGHRHRAIHDSETTGPGNKNLKGTKRPSPNMFKGRKILTDINDDTVRALDWMMNSLGNGGEVVPRYDTVVPSSSVLEGSSSRVPPRRVHPKKKVKTTKKTKKTKRPHVMDGETGISRMRPLGRSYGGGEEGPPPHLYPRAEWELDGSSPSAASFPPPPQKTIALPQETLPEIPSGIVYTSPYRYPRGGMYGGGFELDGSSPDAAAYFEDTSTPSPKAQKGRQGAKAEGVRGVEGGEKGRRPPNGEATMEAEMKRLQQLVHSQPRHFDNSPKGVSDAVDSLFLAGELEELKAASEVGGEQWKPSTSGGKGGTWTEWSEWGQCLCGQQIRTRACEISGVQMAGCEGNTYERQPCTGGDCPSPRLHHR